MKNVVLLILALILTSTSVYAFYERFMVLEPGVYTCTLSYQKAKCIVKQDKLGGTYYHNCGSITDSTIKRLLNEKKCTYSPDRNKYYTCQYVDGSCSVILYSPSSHSVQCSGNIDADKALQDAKAGKCYSN